MGRRLKYPGRTIDFPGYLRAYVEGADDPDSDLAEHGDVLPAVTVGQRLECRHIEPKSHATQPPNRYSEASLTRALEEMGIGRPSTYASIIDTILARDYVFKLKRGNVLVPTWTAFAVCQLLEAHLPDLIDYQFTAEMEDELDAISRGEMGHLDYLKQFYFGNAHPGLKDQVKSKVDEIDARVVCRVLIGTPSGKPGAEAEPVFVRVGRYGPFLEQGEKRASIPDRTPPDEITLAAALVMLDKAAAADEPLGVCPETQKPVYLRLGRFGPYVQRGSTDDEEKPQNASLLKGMEPEDVTLEVALKLLLLPRTLGDNPTDGQPVVAHNGRYGPYVKCGEETRSLPEGVSPLDVTLAQALELLAQPKAARGRGSARKEPIKVFEVSPVTNEPVRLMEGRYGPYVTDGTTNASLPKGAAVEEITLPFALELLKTRAEKGPSKRFTRKRPAKKAPAAKSAAAKSPKKPVKKKPKTARAKTPRKKKAEAKPS